MKKIQILKNKKPNNVKFVYDGQNAIIESDGILCAIEIMFLGRIRAEDTMPDGWVLQIGEGRLIAVNFGSEAPLGTIFKYKGSFGVTKVNAYSYGYPTQAYNVAVQDKQIDVLDSDPATMDDFPERLTQHKKKNVSKNEIINLEKKVKGVDDGVSRY